MSHDIYQMRIMSLIDETNEFSNDKAIQVAVKTADDAMAVHSSMMNTYISRAAELLSSVELNDMRDPETATTIANTVRTVNALAKTAVDIRNSTAKIVISKDEVEKTGDLRSMIAAMAKSVGDHKRAGNMNPSFEEVANILAASDVAGTIKKTELIESAD